MKPIFKRFVECAVCKDFESCVFAKPFHTYGFESINYCLQGCKSDPSLLADLRRIVYQQKGGTMVSRLDDDQIIALAAGMINTGLLRTCHILHGGEERTQAENMRAPEHVTVDRILANLRTKTKDFLFEGKILRIISANQWLDLRKDERYQVIPKDEAQKIMEYIASGPTISQIEKNALKEAAPMIADTSRRWFDKGILLLRITPVRNRPVGKESPTFTPSQLIRTKETHWIEIELIDQDGKPVADEEYLIVTPDKEEHRGKTDAEGWARLDKIVEGQCKVSFPKLDKACWYLI